MLVVTTRQPNVYSARPSLRRRTNRCCTTIGASPSCASLGGRRRIRPSRVLYGSARRLMWLPRQTRVSAPLLPSSTPPPSRPAERPLARDRFDRPHAYGCPLVVCTIP